MAVQSQNSFECIQKVIAEGRQAHYFSLPTFFDRLSLNAQDFPYSIKILLENLLRHEDGYFITKDSIESIARGFQNRSSVSDSSSVSSDILFYPARVLMQDFTGVPAIVDLASMRAALSRLSGDPKKINPKIPVDLVIDHSIIVDAYGTKNSFQQNQTQEYQRNQERYAFLKWGQTAFNNLRVVPPNTGICHQINLESLARVVWLEKEQDISYLYPDTLIGTDSHTTMINALSILGWGCGGIEAEAAMLGQPISMQLPQVIGFRLKGNLPPASTATDLVLTITEILRKARVVGKFVEFYGEGLAQLSLPDRATIANMSPEFGSTCAFFPTDEETLEYLKSTGREANHIECVEAYTRAQKLWHDPSTAACYQDTIELDLSTVEPCVAGPKRPQDRILLSCVPKSFQTYVKSHEMQEASPSSIKSGDIAIAAITSCTNTSNPSVMMGAGLLAQKAVALGLTVKPWVKTSLAPGSQVVTDYLRQSDLQKSLDALGFHLVGYGCTTCIGNSGPLGPEIEKDIIKQDLVVASVLSGNRNFEGRIHPLVKANYLASPLLVVAYALVGSILVDITTEPLGQSSEGQWIYLKDIWPSPGDIKSLIRQHMSPSMFTKRYQHIFDGDQQWRDLDMPQSPLYHWKDSSTYIREPSFFSNMEQDKHPLQSIENARVLALLGDSVTTDHISPAGAIPDTSPAGQYLQCKGIPKEHFNSYGSRRGNHEVMVRGTFASLRLQNEMIPHKTGGYTYVYPEGEEKTIYEASCLYAQRNTPLIVIAGQEYGTGSSRDWAAKGAYLLGVRAVVAESFERIHRSNLIGMGILPLIFPEGVSRKTLGLQGTELYHILGIENLMPGGEIEMKVFDNNNLLLHSISLTAAMSTKLELEYYKNQGILPYVLRSII